MRSARATGCPRPTLRSTAQAEAREFLGDAIDGVRVNRDRQLLLATQISDGMSGGGGDKVAGVEIAEHALNDAHGKLSDLRLDRLEIAIDFQGRLGDEAGRFRLAVLIASGTLRRIEVGGGFLRLPFVFGDLLLCFVEEFKGVAPGFHIPGIDNRARRRTARRLLSIQGYRLDPVHHGVHPQPTARRTIAGPSSSKGRFTASSSAGSGASLRRTRRPTPAGCALHHAPTQRKPSSITRAPS